MSLRLLLRASLSYILLMSACIAAGEALPVRDTMSDTWVATDALGRTLPANTECGMLKSDKTVTMFYYIWMQRTEAGVFDISKLLAENPDNPKYGPSPAFHWWGEPHLGYYLSSDPFVIRKHAQMLADAGVDAVAFDVTNAALYESTCRAICQAYQEIRAVGGKTPQIAFLTNTKSTEMVQKLYNDFYSKNQFPELWFRWLGKPLMMASPEGLSDEIKSFFTLRHSWAWTNAKSWFKEGKDKWPWLDHHPQKPGWHESPDQPEQISVCVAQHPISNIGRSFHDKKEPPPAERRTAEGLNFAEQWRRALEVNPQVVFVTEWNEWLAQRFIKKPKEGPGEMLGQKLKDGDSFFVDEYNQEFSRDIEPMRGGHGDSYYYQLVDNIRRYKGVRPIPHATPAKTIAIAADFNQWKDVGPEYLDDLKDTTHRNNKGFSGKTVYVNTTGRNDLDAMKVARDKQNLYFYVRTLEPLTDPLNSPNWMLLFLDTDRNGANGWNGYEFVINRMIKSTGGLTGSVERSTGGWAWESVGEVTVVTKGNEMHFAIPRKLLRLDADKEPLCVDFKWADNVPESGEIMDFIDKGDVAPNGRFKYRYSEGQ